MGFPCGSAGKEFACLAGDLGLIPGLGRSPGDGNSYPLHYSVLQNSMDCIFRGVAKNPTQLSDLYFVSDFLSLTHMYLLPSQTLFPRWFFVFSLFLFCFVFLLVIWWFPFILCLCSSSFRFLWNCCYVFDLWLPSFSSILMLSYIFLLYNASEYIALCWGKSVYAHFLESFYHKWVLNIIKCFFCISCEDHMVFICQFVDVVYHTDWFVDGEESLHSWDKSHLIMMYSPVNVLLHLVC